MKIRLFCFLFIWFAVAPFAMARDTVNPLKLCVTISGKNGSGSGFIAKHEGKFYVVTNNHVILELDKPIIKGVNGETMRFTEVLSALDRDVALIPIAPPASGNAMDIEEHVDDIWPNEALTCLGDSEGMGVVVVCSGKFLGLGATFFETDAPFVPGNSGGPIIRDKSRKVAGVATYMTPLSNAEWAAGTRFDNVRGNAIRRFATRLDNLDWKSLVRLDSAEIQEAYDALASARVKSDGEHPSLGWEQIHLYHMATQGLPEAQNALGIIYDSTQAHAEAVKWYRKAAEQGYVNAQYNLGICYANGEGVPQDYVEAAKWYRKAANQGNAMAQYNLGLCYYNGKGVPQDYAEAVKCFRRAAEQGYANAQNILGVCYAKGKGVPQDYAEAAKWYRKAAEQGDAMAQWILGISYANGKGVPQDNAEAVKWYRKAAEQGNAMAQCELGISYVAGKGVPQDYAEAVKWYRRAAEQGYANAQYCLGVSYAFGIGLPKDKDQAAKWYRRAAEQGYAKAQDALRQLGLIEV